MAPEWLALPKSLNSETRERASPQLCEADVDLPTPEKVLDQRQALNTLVQRPKAYTLGSRFLSSGCFFRLERLHQREMNPLVYKDSIFSARCLPTLPEMGTVSQATPSHHNPEQTKATKQNKETTRQPKAQPSETWRTSNNPLPACISACAPSGPRRQPWRASA